MGSYPFATRAMCVIQIVGKYGKTNKNSLKYDKSVHGLLKIVKNYCILITKAK